MCSNHSRKYGLAITVKLVKEAELSTYHHDMLDQTTSHRAALIQNDRFLKKTLTGELVIIKVNSSSRARYISLNAMVARRKSSLPFYVGYW